MGEVTEACDGSVAHSDFAVEGQRWCLSAGRYCKHADVQACVKSATALTATQTKGSSNGRDA